VLTEPIASPASAHPGLVLAPGPHGRCDDFRVGGAVVHHDPADGRWWMWYYCRNHEYDRPAPQTLGSGRIALATSADGIAWERVDGPLELGSVMIPAAAPDRFDCGHIGLTDVTRDDAGWRMWYFGGALDVVRTGKPLLGDMPGLAMRIGQALSTDGTTWRRVPGRQADGALFDILPDELYAAWPNAIPQGHRTLLQYTAPTHDMDAYRTRVVAVAPDGAVTRLGDLQWLDGASSYDVGGIVTRHVIASPLPGTTGWVMIYTALDAEHGRSIGIAGSEDGIGWRHLTDRPILVPGSPGDWDDCGVAANRLVVAGDRLYLYYYGFRSLTATDAPRGIGLAIADIADPFRFRRVGTA
jgi:hypothetical protein